MLRDASDQANTATEQRVLAEVGEIMASSPEYEERMTRIADLSVRFLSDCSIVEVLDQDDRVKRLRVSVADPAKKEAARRLHELPLDPALPSLASKTFETRRSVLLSDVSEYLLESLTQSEEHLQILRDLAPRSLIAVPLLARERLVGAIVLLSCRPDRRYGSRDLWLAEEIARRAAVSIDNARLYRAANQALLARDQVLGVVAHDLRTPLNTIALTSSNLLHARVQLDAGMREGLERISRSVERTNRLVQDLLDVTALAGGRIRLDRAPHSPARLVAEATEAVRPVPPVELEVRVPDDLPAVVADRGRVLQVLSNLVENAMKFTRGGRITVGASTRGEEVLFHVADTGCGIPEQDLERIFDRFWQVKETDRRGLGLGLAISKGIVEAHGGRIWAESQHGVGSTFFFTLPAVPVVSGQRSVSPPEASS